MTRTKIIRHGARVFAALILCLAVFARAQENESDRSRQTGRQLRTQERTDVRQQGTAQERSRMDAARQRYNRDFYGQMNRIRRPGFYEGRDLWEQQGRRGIDEPLQRDTGREFDYDEFDYEMDHEYDQPGPYGASEEWYSDRYDRFGGTGFDRDTTGRYIQPSPGRREWPQGLSSDYGRRPFSREPGQTYRRPFYQGRELWESPSGRRRVLTPGASDDWYERPSTRRFGYTTPNRRPFYEGAQRWQNQQRLRQQDRRPSQRFPDTSRQFYRQRQTQSRRPFYEGTERWQTQRRLYQQDRRPLMPSERQRLERQQLRRQEMRRQLQQSRTRQQSQTQSQSNQGEGGSSQE